MFTTHTHSHAHTTLSTTLHMPLSPHTVSTTITRPIFTCCCLLLSLQPTRPIHFKGCGLHHHARHTHLCSIFQHGYAYRYGFKLAPMGLGSRLEASSSKMPRIHIHIMEWPIDKTAFCPVGWIHRIVITAWSALTQAHTLPFLCGQSQSDT